MMFEVLRSRRKVSATKLRERASGQQLSALNCALPEFSAAKPNVPALLMGSPPFILRL